MRAPKSKDLKSDTVKVGFLVTLSGVAVALAKLAGIWGFITPDVEASIHLSIPLFNIVLGPLVMHFRVNQKTQL